VAKAGIPFVVLGLLLGALCLLLWRITRWNLFRAVAIPCFAFGAFSAYFFRDPERHPPDLDGAVVAPADGKVVEIVSEDNKYVGPGARRVSIFLSVFNVHVNRVPVSGEVTAVEYNPGKFLAAWNEKASSDNEQTHIALNTPYGPVAFKQIAGYVARRIIYDLSLGDAVRIGDRFGLIRFGSRMDVMMPADVDVRVNIGDRVTAGETVIGVLR
jgi:phosphatidylserine decarboxylase